MEYDKDKVDEMVLALLFLTIHDGGRAWKGHDWGAMDRLHKKGMILDPVGKAKSVVLTDEGEKRCEDLFRKHFCSSVSKSKPRPGCKWKLRRRASFVGR
jgi:hypothetical protein